MNKMKIRFSTLYSFLLILGISLVATKCPEPEPPTISREWKVKEVFINGTKDQVTDYSSYRRHFKASGDYTFTDAPGIVNQGKWKVISNNQRVLLDEGTAKEQTVAIIDGIKDNQLDLELTVPGNYKTGEQKVLYKLIP